MKHSPMIKACLIILLLVWIPSSQSQSTIIQTSSGPVQGSEVSIDGHKVYQYLGIPYAQPPLGDLRFGKPQPVQQWLETLKADKMPPACIQYSEYPFPWFDFEHGKSEDCLYLNIWVPQTESYNKEKKSVMFWIHGGGFAYGSIRMPVYNGAPLAAVGDVIIVTINYRLGAFGFFSTNTEEAPMNNAMYDMLEALKWVNENIDAFNGDPDQVTVFGESAGSIATGLFCVSPLTKGLFSRVIMESGSPAVGLTDLNIIANLEISQKLAEDLGCADSLTRVSTFPDKVVQCMRKKDAFEIAKTLNSYDPNTGVTYFPISGDEFVPQNAREALISGKFHDVSVLIGNNQDEGSVFLTFLFPELFGFFGEKLPEFNTSVAENLLKDIFKDILGDIPDTDIVTQTILGNLKEDDYRKNLKIIYDFLGDFTLVCPDVYVAESFSRYGKDAYFYFFKHRPSTTPWAKWMGVAHYEEVQFVFGSPLLQNNYTEEEVALSKLMIEMWSNFAKFGYPLHDESKQDNTPEAGLVQSDLELDKWPKYSRETPLYLMLDKTTRKAKRYNLGPEKTNCDLFRAVYGFP